MSVADHNAVGALGTDERQPSTIVGCSSAPLQVSAVFTCCCSVGFAASAKQAAPKTAVDKAAEKVEKKRKRDDGSSALPVLSESMKGV